MTDPERALPGHHRCGFGVQYPGRIKGELDRGPREIQVRPGEHPEFDGVTKVRRERLHLMRIGRPVRTGELRRVLASRAALSGRFPYSTAGCAVAGARSEGVECASLPEMTGFGR